LIIGGFKGEVEGFFNEDVVGAFKDDIGPFWGVLQVIDEV